MKIKTIVLGIIFMSMSQILFAQISFGVQGGLSMFKMAKFKTVEGAEQSDFTSSFLDGYYAEGYMDVAWKNNLSIQAGISLISKGEAQRITRNHEFYNASNDYRQETLLKFVELPVLAKYNLSLNEKVKLQLGAGVSAGYLYQIKNKIRQNWKVTTEEIAINTDPNSPIKINRWDISPIADLSMSRMTKVGDFKVGFRGSFDLTNQIKIEDNAPFEYVEKNYNWGMVFYAGYVINKGQFKKS